MVEDVVVKKFTAFAISSPDEFLVLACKWLMPFAADVQINNKSSAVAEMGDRLASIGRNVGAGLLCPFACRELGTHLTQCGQGDEAYLRTK